MEEGRQPIPGGDPVPQLRAVFGCADGQAPVDQAIRQRELRPGALGRVQCRRGAHIEDQLHPTVGGVNRLPAGSRGTGEPLS